VMTSSDYGPKNKLVSLVLRDFKVVDTNTEIVLNSHSDYISSSVYWLAPEESKNISQVNFLFNMKFEEKT